MDAKALVKIMFVKNSDIERYIYLHIHCFEIKSISLFITIVNLSQLVVTL